MLVLQYKVSKKKIAECRTELECKWRAYEDYARQIGINPQPSKIHDIWKKKLNKVYEIIKK